MACSLTALCSTIGPGAYESKIGFEKQAGLAGMRSQDKFFTIDNGHVNMRP